MDDGIELGEILCVMSAALQGIRAEMRAARLEAQARHARLSEADAEALSVAQACADEVAGLFVDEPECAVRVLS